WSTRGRGAGSHRCPAPHDALDPDRRGAFRSEPVRHPSHPQAVSHHRMHLVSGPARSTRWMRAALGALGLLAGRAGCVTPGAPPKSPYQKSTTADDITTASDQTAADRLANTPMELAQAH